MVKDWSSAMAPAPTPGEQTEDSLSSTVKGIVWLATGLPLVFVWLRCYTRLYLRRVFGLDDWFMVAAMVLLLAYAVVVNIAASKGLGQHLDVVLQDPENAQNVALLSLASQPLVIMSCALGKTSFAITLMRVAAQRWICVLLWIVILTMTLLHALVSIFVFARCKDPRHLWNPAIPSECWRTEDFDNFSMFIGSYSAAVDFILALLPWAILWKLQMKKKEKFGVAFAMSLGGFAGAVAIIKITHLAANGDETDVTYSLAPLLWWAGTENGLILIAACVPTLRPLLKNTFRRTPPNSKTSNSHALSTISSLNMFTPASKQGHWSTIIETEAPIDRTSDDQSERSILKQQGDGRVREASATRSKTGDRLSNTRHHIRKTMEVNVAYDER